MRKPQRQRSALPQMTSQDLKVRILEEEYGDICLPL